ncbi:hypothetical protein M0638_27750 [Roseomonas sp. NAR14]|uniref:Uncharacterized protein n=1 Tax=Roseomonas acroporae TaxID=2937791 RepID=A0A9X1YCA8_9PROT|nr:hypothetical protein [Roseomonas acroporae]MCK8788149.1 hypothetical protein [Roseomonas acroporae]
MKVGDRLLLPRRYALDENENGNLIRQLLHAGREATVDARRANHRGTPDGFVLKDASGASILLLGRKPRGDEGVAQLLVAKRN